MSKIKLSIELVPETCFCSNLRSELPTKDWDIIRKGAYADAGYRCKICSGKGSKHPVEAHEVWEYDEKACVQILVGVIALCPDCHTSKHYGLAQIRGNEGKAISQLMKVNGWSRKEVEKHVCAAFAEWENRSEHKWELDLSWLESRGIKVPR